MDNRWTLHLEDFGKIEYADVTVAPLTLFVGDNNSGKSYLMTLLYTLLRMDFQDLDLCENTEEYRWCADWIMPFVKEAQQNGTIEVPFHTHAFLLFENLLNRILNTNRQEISRLAFNSSIPMIGQLRITFQEYGNRTLRIQFVNESSGEDPVFSFDLIQNSTSFFDATAMIPKETVLLTGELNFVIAYLLAAMLKLGFSHDISHHLDVAFLPISRTGFLLTYSPLTGDAVSRTYGYNKRRTPNVQLTPPCADFLKTIATINRENENQRTHSIVRFIENHMIHGRIYVSNDLPMPTFSYGPNHAEKDFPMFLSSGVVTELTPLLLLLQYTPIHTLFIEEPEMSLHPELQQKMARVLIRLANQNTPVFVTTHSNTMIQHVNNMIKLSYLPEETQTEIMARFGFDPSDLISDKDISMCQFHVQENGRTMVRRLSGDEYGFLVPTFRDALKNMLDQARATRQEI